MPKKPSLPAADFLTRYGAGVLCDSIESYWRSRGYMGVVVERYELPGKKSVYGIRSNIDATGYPPKHIG